MEQEPIQQQFLAVIEGIELPSEASDRVKRAVQKAVLVEIANLDLQGSVNLHIPFDPADAKFRGPTQGIKTVVRPE